MNVNEDRARSIFLTALERAPEAWPAVLNEACGHDAPLRGRVEQLLHAHQALGSIHGGDAEPSAIDLQAREGPGTVIGAYKLLEQIGEGGFGVVFMAEQTSPVRRKVALKVLKPGMDTRQVIARFEAERQALALMDHPNIAHVFDGGESSSGRPYFVMELVRGAPITTFCDQNHLSVRDRLGLFMEICQAVQHAHQKGIIHRDLKPTNVLVTLHDERAVVKVIDFGIAKATGQQLTEKTLFTNFAQMIGTPLYMSPEQAQLSGLDIDTRSDIYSLGVLLYELLTGTTPFDNERLRTVGYDEMRRIIREVEPARPSTRISTLGDAAATVSANRGSDPQKLRRLVSGELDWVVMKALEKDRNRRYESASAFAADVRRYLTDEPVLACPPSAVYRLSKVARRNRGTLAVAGALGLGLLVAVGGLGWAARGRAVQQAQAGHDLELALDRADLFQGPEKRAQALAALEQAELLARAAPPDAAREARLAALQERLAAEGRDQAFHARFEEILRRVQSDVNVVASQFTKPAAFTAIQDALHAYGMEVDVTPPAQAAALVQGRPDPVRRELVAALDECLRWRPRDSPSTRAWLLATLEAADHDPWRIRARKALAERETAPLEQLAREVDVKTQPPTFLLSVASCLPSKPSSTRLELLRRTQAAYPADLWANHGLASFLASTGHPAEAIRFYTAAIALRPESAGLYLNRGNALFHVGEADAAIADYRRALALAPEYATAHMHLGTVLLYKQDLDGAIAKYQEALQLQPELAEAHYNLAVALKEKGQVDRAIAEYRETIRLNKDFAEAHDNLGIALKERGQVEEAVAEYREAIRIRPDFPEAHTNLGNVLLNRDQLDEAIAEFRAALATKRSFRQRCHAHNGLALALQRQGDVSGAITEYRKAIALMPENANAHWNLASALRLKGELREALKEYRRGHELGSRDPAWPSSRGQWVEQFERQVEEAEKMPSGR